MPKTTEYRLVIGSEQDQFEADVNAALDEGWELHGAPIVRSAQNMGFRGRSGSVFYCQAVIRTEPGAADGGRTSA